MATIAALHPHETASFHTLLRLFANVFAEADAQELPIPDDNALSALLADPNFAAIVARTESEEVVGGLTLRFWPSYRESGEECYLYDLAVDEEHRRQGIAGQLVQFAVDFSKARGVVAMWVQAEAEDEHAVAFYRTLDAQELDVRHFELLV